MPPRVGHAYWRHQHQLANRWKGVFPHEDAMAECLGRDARPIAREIGGLGGRTLRQWKNRYDSEHRGPARTLEMVMRAALKLGRPLEQALAPLYALAGVFGLLLVDPNAPELHAVESPLKLSARALRESGEAIQVLANAVRDQRLSTGERLSISKQAREAAQAYMNIACYAEQNEAEGAGAGPGVAS